CGYCNGQQFFLNTIEFTEEVESPASPWTDASSGMNSTEKAGRAWFDAMNCSRCHADDAVPFTRTVEDAMVLTTGPRFFNAKMLSDPTQIFVSNDQSGGTLFPNDNSSLRNMTDVGTRTGSQNLVDGVNTPSLAGLWDNSPYLHDGRYRDLDAVLSHTWVNEDIGYRAASWVNPGTLPDNFNNSMTTLPPGVGPVGVTDADGNVVVPPYQFETHGHGEPVGDGTWYDVKSYLESEHPGAYPELVTFLMSLSSQKEPYPSNALTLSNVAVGPSDQLGHVRLTFDTSIPVIGRVTLSFPDSQPGAPRWTHLAQFTTGGPALHHEFDLVLKHPESGMPAVSDDWKADIDVRYGFASKQASIGWSNIPVAHAYEIEPNRQDLRIVWSTSSSTTSDFEWFESGNPGGATSGSTPADTEHSLVIPDAANTAWRINLVTHENGLPAFTQFSQMVPGTEVSAVTFAPTCNGLSWTTDLPVGCIIDWGPASDPYPVNRLTSAPGYSHSVNVQLQVGVEYRAFVWTQYLMGSSDSSRKMKFCASNPNAQGDDPGTPTKPEIAFRVSPNPFNPRTTIEFGMATAGPVDLRIYDVRGRLIRTLISEPRSAGQHVEIWNGTDDTGTSVASGVYYLQLRAGQDEHRAKLLLVE
ncbi:MAG: hypothetical protein DRQ65_07295, partial [Gammaproteobacteria bacterium]